MVDSEAGADKLQVCLENFHARNTLWNTLPANLPEITNYTRFIRSIRSGKSEAPTFEDGARGRAYQDACIASAESGKSVRVRLPG